MLFGEKHKNYINLFSADGFVSFKEYIEMMAVNYHNINMEAERMKTAFKILDKNGDGYISLKEFKVLLINIVHEFGGGGYFFVKNLKKS